MATKGWNIFGLLRKCSVVMNEVARVAKRLNGIVSSSSSAERVFSSFGFTWTKLRNRLRSDLVKQICFVRHRPLHASKAATKRAASSANESASNTLGDRESDDKGFENTLNSSIGLMASILIED